MKKLFSLPAAILIMVFVFSNSCTNGNTPAFLKNEKGGSGNFTHYIGELFGGGIVAAVWKVDGVEHGLIASLSDLSEGIAWSNIDTVLVGLNAQNAINGQINTVAIVGQVGATLTAAGLCDKYTGGGFDDWYLPSKFEMSQLYNSALPINVVLEADADKTTMGFEFVNNPFYWTSTEFYNAKAWLQNFFIGTTYNDFKYFGYRVRAVRRF
jgi:hypothetical protein